MTDILAAALNQICTAIERRKTKVKINGYSKLLGHVLRVMQKEGYIGTFSISEDSRTIEVEIYPKLHKCHAIKPRFPVSVEEIDKYARRYLPTILQGILIISSSTPIKDGETNLYLLTHREALQLGVGGVLLAYVY